MNKKGFTLIELMLVVVLSVILITVIGGFLIANVRMFNTTKVHMEAQGDLQNAMDGVTNYLIGIKGISNWSDLNPDISSGKLKQVELENLDGSKSVLVYDAEKKQVQKKDGSSTQVLGTNVTEISIEPLSKTLPVVSPSPSNSELASTFENCVGFRISITVRVENYSMSGKNDVYFRNKQ